jgi:PAS domain S-box-containing protein
VGAVLGYDRARVDAMGARLLDELLHPEDALRYVGHARRLAALADGEAAEFEYRMRRSDGTWLWLSSREMVFARDADGAVRQIVGTAVDISGRKAIEERLAASEERLQLALSAVGAGVFDWDLDGGALVWDARVWALIDADPGVPAHVDRWLERVHPDEIAEVRARIDRVLHDPRSDGAWRLRHRIRRAAGGWRWLDALGRVHFEGEGAARRPVRFVGVLLDASDEVETAERLVASQRALEESVAALREADRRKDEFLATLAHELRNPLAPIVNAVRLLEAGRTGMAPMAARAVDMIARQTRQMRHLVDDLLEMSRITRGTVTLKPERVVVGTLVAGAVEAAQPAALAKRQRLEVALPDRPVEIVADPVRVAQVLENLVGNALKYTPQEGSIRVALGEARDGHVEIVVADDGIGIPAGRLEEIFELFVQAEPGVGEHQGGLGIGLAMVKRLVELHGGTVRAASAGRGRGATFVVRLPAAGPPPA